MYIDQPQFLKFNISVQKDALVGVYGRKGLPPSHTQVGCLNTTHTMMCMDITSQLPHSMNYMSRRDVKCSHLWPSK